MGHRCISGIAHDFITAEIQCFGMEYSLPFSLSLNIEISQNEKVIIPNYPYFLISNIEHICPR